MNLFLYLSREKLAFSRLLLHKSVVLVDPRSVLAIPG